MHFDWCRKTDIFNLNWLAYRCCGIAFVNKFYSIPKIQLLAILFVLDGIHLWNLSLKSQSCRWSVLAIYALGHILLQILSLVFSRSFLFGWAFSIEFRATAWTTIHSNNNEMCFSFSFWELICGHWILSWFFKRFAERFTFNLLRIIWFEAKWCDALFQSSLAIVCFQVVTFLYKSLHWLFLFIYFLVFLFNFIWCAWLISN